MPYVPTRVPCWYLRHFHHVFVRCCTSCPWPQVFVFARQTSDPKEDTAYMQQLGVGRSGQSVHMVVHHSRNTAAKQWSETLVLILQGVRAVFVETHCPRALS